MPKRWWLNQLNTEKPERLVEFYKAFGFVDDHGFDLRPGAEVPAHFTPGELCAALGYDGADRLDTGLTRAMLRLPGDVARVEILGWKEGTLRSPGPRYFNSQGLVRIGLLVDDLDKELAALAEREVPVLWSGEITWLNWGVVKAAFLYDPDGNVVELVEADVENN
ncbi:hypothetical protein [Pseudonocardia xishanensis]|uniref:VOC domain-containing protein n=1 Tax=Pseudonocardia xishanensis TaxID=630995 RepID=A0ABP8RTP1_9PSEU